MDTLYPSAPRTLPPTPAVVVFRKPVHAVRHVTAQTRTPPPPPPTVVIVVMPPPPRPCPRLASPLTTHCASSQAVTGRKEREHGSHLGRMCPTQTQLSPQTADEWRGAEDKPYGSGHDSMSLAYTATCICRMHIAGCAASVCELLCYLFCSMVALVTPTCWTLCVCVCVGALCMLCICVWAEIGSGPGDRFFFADPYCRCSADC